MVSRRIRSGGIVVDELDDDHRGVVAWASLVQT